MNSTNLTPVGNQAVVQAPPTVGALLSQIRPAWQAKNLIERVRRLVVSDMSSACQRLFNAAIHDLREKLVIAGIDIAREAAKQHKLPPVEKPEDIENYSVSNIIDLAYRVGLLSRPEWRRVSRCYEIRRDLEHEDDEYEAGVEDTIYIFTTCIEVILSRDPVYLVRVQDVKQLIEQPNPVHPAESLITDYAQAPQPRQEEIFRFLLSIALDKSQSEIVQQNAYNFLSRFGSITQNSVKLALASHLQEKIGRQGIDKRVARVAFGAGLLPYLKRADVGAFFSAELAAMQKVGSDWRQFAEHGDLLRSFKEVGGLQHCPQGVRGDILKFLVLTYLGEPGGRTSWGNVRHVFFSDTAAPLIEDLVRDARAAVAEELKALTADDHVKRRISNTHIARRFDKLLDIVESAT